MGSRFSPAGRLTELVVPLLEGLSRLVGFEEGGGEGGERPREGVNPPVFQSTLFPCRRTRTHESTNRAAAKSERVGRSRAEPTRDGSTAWSAEGGSNRVESKRTDWKAVSCLLPPRGVRPSVVGGDLLRVAVEVDVSPNMTDLQILRHVLELASGRREAHPRADLVRVLDKAEEAVPGDGRSLAGDPRPPTRTTATTSAGTTTTSPATTTVVVQVDRRSSAVVPVDRRSSIVGIGRGRSWSPSSGVLDRSPSSIVAVARRTSFVAVAERRRTASIVLGRLRSSS